MTPLTLLHISDLHFGPPFVPAVGEAMLRAAHALEPDVVVISGDFTQRAKREQFVEARDFLRRLPAAPRIVTPGNHDVPLYRVMERIMDPYGMYREFISDRLDEATRVDGAIIVSLNSAAPLRAITNGRISRLQLEFCARAFERAPEDWARIVVAHHHFAPAPDFDRDEVMPQAQRAIDLFVQMKVDMIMGGHLHRAFIGNSLDFYPSPDRERGIIIVQSGTSTSFRGRARETEKNSFNLVQIDDETVRVAHYMYFADEDAFAPMSRHLFPRPGMRLLRSHDKPTEETRAPSSKDAGGAGEPALRRER